MFTPRRLIAAALAALAVTIITQDVTGLAFFIGYSKHQIKRLAYGFRHSAGRQ